MTYLYISLIWLGFTINRVIGEGLNRHGNNTRFTIYSMPKSAKNQRLLNELFPVKNKCK